MVMMALHQPRVRLDIVAAAAAVAVVNIKDVRRVVVVSYMIVQKRQRKG